MIELGYDGTLKFDTKIDEKGFQDGVSSIGTAAKSALSATTKIIGASATAIAGLGTAAVKVGMDFEASMSNVAAISGATGKELDQLTEKAKEMGAKTKFSASESADAFSYMAMAGWKTADMLNGIEGIMNLAAASGEDLATTSDIVTDALTAFGLQAADSSHFADVMAAASSSANTNVGLMGETFKYVAPVAGALGFSIEDSATAIGLMANAGIKGSQAGTQLRAVLSRMTKPTKEVQTAMDKLGLSITDRQGNMKSLGDIMGDLREGFSGLSEAEAAETAAALGGQEAMSGLLAIVNASEADYQKLTDAIAGATDETTGYSAAADMAATMNDNLQGQITILKSNLEGLGITISEQMDEPLKNVAISAQGMVDDLKTAFESGGFQGLVTAAGSAFAEIAVQAANQAPALIDAALSLCESFIGSIMENKEQVAESAVTLITALVEGILSFGGDLWSAAIELGAEIVSGLVEKAPEIGQAGLDCVSQIVSSMTTALPEMATAGAELLNNLAQGISENLPELIPVAMESLVSFSSSLRENAGLLVDAGLNLISSLAESLIANIPTLIETVPTIITNLANIINDNAPKLLATGIELLGKLAMGLIQAIPVLIANIPQIIQAIVAVFTAFNWLELGTNIITFIKDGVVSLAQALPEALRNIGNSAKEALHNIDWATLGSNVINFIVDGITGLISAIPDTLLSIGNSAVELFKSIDWVDLGLNIIGGIIAGLTGALDGLLSAAGDVCSGLLDSVKGFFGINSPSTVMEEQGGYLVDGLVNGLQSLSAEAEGPLSEMLQAAISFGQDMAAQMGQSFDTNQLSENITNAGTTIVDFFTSVSDNVKGLADGAAGWLSSMGAAMQQGAASAVEAANVPFSTLPEQIGMWLTQTSATMMQFGADLVTQATTSATTAITNIVTQFSTLAANIAPVLSGVMGQVASWGASLASSFVTIGVNAIQGLINGISSMVGSLYDSIRGALSGLVDKAKSALGIGSPSKVMREQVGSWIPPGISEGIQEQMPKLERDAQKEMANLSRKMRMAVQIDTGAMVLEKKENAQHQAAVNSPVITNKFEAQWKGESTTNVYLDGRKVGKAVAPYVDEVLG